MVNLHVKIVADFFQFRSTLRALEVLFCQYLGIRSQFVLLSLRELAGFWRFFMLGFQKVLPQQEPRVEQLTTFITGVRNVIQIVTHLFQAAVVLASIKICAVHTVVLVFANFGEFGFLLLGERCPLTSRDLKSRTSEFVRRNHVALSVSYQAEFVTAFPAPELCLEGVLDERAGT